MAYTISDVAICNIALIELNANPITDLAGQSDEAVACNAIFDYTRRELLRSHPWNFAIKQVELAQSTETPVHTYNYKYAIPSDLLRLWEVKDNYDYKRQENYIVTNNTSCVITYVYDNSDTSTWDSSFVDVMARSLAYRLAYNMTGSNTKVETSLALYEKALRSAKSIDGSEDIQDTFAEQNNSLLSVRSFF